VSTTTIWKIVKKFDYSWKKKTMYAAEKKSERVQKKRAEFRQQMREVADEDLVFLDESGVNLAMVRLYARSKKGQRARGERPQKRGQNISILSALSRHNVLASVNVYGAVDPVTFEAFLVTKLVPLLWQGAYVVLDNARIHFGEMVTEAIENAGAKLVYLSPYSPEFSPIENFWSKIKSILRKLQARTYQDLIDSITEAMLQVTEEQLHNWFTHCCYCTS
jgi:transposase